MFTFKRSITVLSAIVIVSLAAPAAFAALVPFTEDFAADAADWRDISSAVLAWSPSGGPDGSSFASGDFNFMNSAADDTPVILRAQDEFGSSAGAFEGDWIADGITEFTVFVRHNAPLPLTFFTRFSSSVNFPGAVAIVFQPVLPNTWTQIAFAIDENSPQFISFETSDFQTIFSNIGHLQLGVSVPAALAGLDQAFTFDIDQPHIASSYQFDVPSGDRWHYPFNFTPGVRANGTAFGAVGPFYDGFNDRDGENVFIWDTSSQIPPGMGSANYPIRAMRIVLTHKATEFEIPSWNADMTVDEWFTFDADGDGMVNADGIARGEPGDTDGESDDSDPGRPIELFGAGFGPTYTLETYNEFSLYVGSDSTSNVPRDPYPFVYRINEDQSVDMLHAEDPIKGLHNESLMPPEFQFTADPWAVGVPVGYTPLAQTEPFEVIFDVDLCQSSDLVRQYFQEQLDAGKLVVVVTSLTESVTMGDPLQTPNFYMKESTDPAAQPAMLMIELGDNFADCNGNGIADECEVLADTDGSGDVDASDLATVLGQWGDCPAEPEPCTGDTSCDGVVDSVDLAEVLGKWGPVP